MTEQHIVPAATGTTALAVPLRSMVGRGLALSTHFTDVLAVAGGRAKSLLHAAGDYVLPELEEQGFVRRFGSGGILNVFWMGGHEYLIVTPGGATLVQIDARQTLWAFDCPTSGAALSASGRLLALATANGVVVRDCQTGFLQRIDYPHEVGSLSFSSDDRMLAFAIHETDPRKDWRSGTVVYDLWDGREVFRRPTPPQLGGQARVTCVSHSPTKPLIAIAEGRAVILADYETGRSERIRVSANVLSLRFRQDGEQVSFVTAKTYTCWNISWRDTKEALLGSLDDSLSGNHALSYSVDGAQLAIGLRGGNLFLPDVAAGDRVAYGGPNLEGICAVHNRDGRTAVLGWTETKLLEIDIETKRWRVLYAIASVAPSQVDALRVCSRSEQLTAVYADDVVRKYGLRDGSSAEVALEVFEVVLSSAIAKSGNECAVVTDGGLFLQQELLGTESVVSSVHLQDVDDRWFPIASISQDLTMVAGVCDEEFALWHTSDGRQLAVYPIYSNEEVYGIRFSPNKEYVAMMLQEDSYSRVRLTTLRSDLPAGDVGHIDDYGELDGMAFSRDSRLFAFGTPDSLEIRDLLTGAILECARDIGEWIHVMEFEPHGHLLAVGAGDEVSLWSMYSGAKVAQMSVSCGARVSAIAFSDDGSVLVAGDSAGIIWQWRVPEVDKTVHWESIWFPPKYDSEYSE